jgi:hypothetical protein
MNIEVQKFIKPMLGNACCRQRVGHPCSLWLGFGRRYYHGNEKLAESYYGEWEIGTYYSAWRVIQNNRIVCGSTDSVESANELNDMLQQIDFGQILSLGQPTCFDVRAEFDTGIAVEFLATISDEDESFGILHQPSHTAVQFAVGKGWAIGPSNLPWIG